MLAQHLIFCCYGFWLPNDERGSGSDYVRSPALLPFGVATKVHTRTSVASREHDFDRRMEAKDALKYAPFIMTPKHRELVAVAVERCVVESGYHVYACAIQKDHIHLVVQAHAHDGDTIMRHIKGRSTQEFKKHRCLPPSTTPWGRNGWKVFLDTPADVIRAIKYVNDNPVKDGEPPQNWSFVEEFGS